MALKMLPVHDCLDCPRLQRKTNNEYECQISSFKVSMEELEAYEIGLSEYMEQFCPLESFDDMFEEAYQKGLEVANMKDEMSRRFRLSTQPTQWFTAQEFMEKLENIR